ncbi:MAG: DUF1080 domain-containing protein [Kiritimatiellae bacterium]|nr:DUF1080 domain-containing protein [Kiritimatiellia bacterium]MDD5522963.1 DUF1080 domain-containing protein [Kiritimatiellia bacterium]
MKTNLTKYIVLTLILSTAAYLTVRAAEPCSFSTEPNTLTEKEKADGWKLLWDGKTGAGWKSIKADTFPEKGWDIKDGVLTVLGKIGGDIVTVDKFSNFDLKLEFKLTRGANSGVKYFIDEDVAREKKAGLGLEYQILDDAVHPDAQKGTAGNHTLGSLYDLITASANKTVKPVGEWNEARILVKGKHVEHWLNGEKVVEFERGSPEFKEVVAKSKFKNNKGFGEFPEGRILIQDHNDTVSYRNIKIKTL